MRTTLIAVLLVLLTISFTLAEQENAEEIFMIDGVALKCPQPTGFGNCIENCKNCKKDELCCSNGCGHTCTKGIKA
ncbi:hypothetical protein CYY_001956 [Polysphondylium violaceum]|uniref:WAP domain-containing protein n=1 Tax=Polysphondylium violaceum TaxID=133409 RepID=A0A8J4Q265_9MYCE|nr:hypothetical protein CYY_001956 [Polysphondylium violaceum]